MSKLYLKNWPLLNWFFSWNWRAGGISDKWLRILCLFTPFSSVLLPRDGSINYTTDNDRARRREFFLKIYSVNNSPRSVIYDFRISHTGWIRVRRRIQHPEKRLVDQTPAVGGRPWKWDNFSGTNFGSGNKDINQSRLIKQRGRW